MWQPGQGERMGEEERNNRGGRKGRAPIYTTRAPTSLAPFVYYRAPGRMVSFLWDPSTMSRAPRLMRPVVV
jgi:hypothetical protein